MNLKSDVDHNFGDFVFCHIALLNRISVGLNEIQYTSRNLSPLSKCEPDLV